MFPKDDRVKVGEILRHNVEDAARHCDITRALKSEADDSSAQRVDFLPAPEQRTIRHLQTLRCQRFVLGNHVGDFLKVELLDRLFEVAKQRGQDGGDGGNLLQTFDASEQSCFDRSRVHVSTYFPAVRSPLMYAVAAGKWTSRNSSETP